MTNIVVIGGEKYKYESMSGGVRVKNKVAPQLTASQGIDYCSRVSTAKPVTTRRGIAAARCAVRASIPCTS